MDIDQTGFRVVLYVIDDLRISFNKRLDHLEPWQIILYTLSVVLFTQWMKKVLKNEEIILPQKWCITRFAYSMLLFPPSAKKKKALNELLLLIPMCKHKVEQNMLLVHKELEDRMLQFDRLKEFYKFLPDRGLSADEIIQEAGNYKCMSDILFERGRFCGAVYAMEIEDPSYQSMLKKVFELYGFTNASFPEVFPSCRKMEAEVIRMLCSLFHGSAKSCGVLTTSGTESIILACLAYRNSALKRGIRKPEIIVGRNAHIAFTKAAKLLGMRIVYVGLNKSMEADAGQVKRAIGRETCMIVASAPGYVTGVMDNIEEFSQLGLRFNIPVHVDASIGGFVIPFMEQCDYPPPNFDFRLSGVTSISVDLHKYGFCPTGSSVVLYRNTEQFHQQCFCDINWSGGVYVSQTLAGTRPGVLVALTWATLLYNGRLGFVEKTQRILDSSRLIQTKIAESVPNVYVVGQPLGPVLTLTTRVPSPSPSEDGDVVLDADKAARKCQPISPHRLGIEMNELGWSLGFLQNPLALRLTISLHQTKSDILDEFVEDLRRSCNKIVEAMAHRTVVTVNNDEGVLSNISTTAESFITQSSKMKFSPIFGMSTAFIDRGMTEYFPIAYIDAYYATPNQPQLSKRTLSIEGRKLSQINVPSGLASLRQRRISMDHNLALPSQREEGPTITGDDRQKDRNRLMAPSL